MKIIIAGAGEVGTHLAKMLAKENLDTILIDADSSKLVDLEANYDLMTYAGEPTSIFTLKECDINKTDLFISVTPSESVNITACILATNLGAKKTLARISNHEYLEANNSHFFAKLGVDYLICPEKLAADEINNSLKNNWLRQNITFRDGALIMLGIKVREKALILNKKFNTGFFDHGKYRIVAINRKSKTIIPDGNNEVKADDVVYFLTKQENLEYVREQAGKNVIKVKNVMVMGGSRIAQRTIKDIPNNINVKVLERNKEKCYYLADKLDKALIINGDGRDVEILVSEGIDEADAFVATTSNSEANILACLEAKRLGVRKTVAEVENIDYLQLAEELDIGTVINKKLIAAAYIYQLTLHADVLEVFSLTSTDAEVVEFVAKEKSKVVKAPIRKLRLPDNVNIGGIIRNGEGIIAYGDTQILPGDHVIVFCGASTIRRIESFFN